MCFGRRKTQGYSKHPRGSKGIGQPHSRFRCSKRHNCSTAHTSGYAQGGSFISTNLQWPGQQTLAPFDVCYLHFRFVPLEKKHKQHRFPVGSLEIVVTNKSTVLVAAFLTQAHKTELGALNRHLPYGSSCYVNSPTTISETN